MHREICPVRMILLALAFCLPVVTVGCAEHRHYRAYDPYYHDYHEWNDTEITYYHQWAIETHRDPNRDFRHLDRDDQQRYWEWRHNHEHDHDHDRR